MRTKRVLIVGGGSAGWTAAAYLNAALNTPNQKLAEICLVESPDVPRIGVGEATVPNINRTLAFIGIDELDFMKATDATFKASIRVKLVEQQERVLPSPVQPLWRRTKGRRRPQMADERSLRALYEYDVGATCTL